LKLLRQSTFTVLILGVTSTAFADEREDRLPDEHRRWLKEEVVYIITDKEKDVFLSLETDEQRNLLIDAFWEKRDPYPATLENEFKTEHYRRIEHADKFFSRDAPMLGWRTDRGKYYIILGEPASIQRYDGLSKVVSSEIWYYDGDPKLGLPPRFNLLFFKDYDVGPYELYHPVSDGPQKLLRAAAGSYSMANQSEAVGELELANIDLAIASITVDLTEMGVNLRASRDPQFYRPSLSADATLANIAESAKKRVSTDHLEGYLRYGDRVSAEYSFNFIPNRSYVTVLPGPDDTPFVHFVIEIDPENFSVEADDQGRFHTTLDIGIEVRDPEGNSIALGNTVPIEMSASQLEQVARSPFAYEDDFPLAVPGRYQMSVTWRNRLTKQFTVMEADIEVPSLGAETSLSNVVPAYRDDWVTRARPEDYLTFQIGAVRMEPAVEGLFAIGDAVHAFTVVRGATPEHRIRFSILDGERALTEREVAVGADGGLTGGTLSLTGIVGGRYRLQAQLVDANGVVVAESWEAIAVSPRTRIPRAQMVYRQGFHAEVPGLLPLARGQQLLVVGRVDEAIAEFQESVDANNPQLPMAKWKLANALLFARQADRALEILLPLKEQFANEYDVVEGLGLAYYLRDEYEAAIPYLEKAMGIRAPDTTVLNALGSCYQATGRNEEAKAFFKRSLELKPDQPAVQEWLAAQGNSGGA
jgi:GWxTD domain-containing protein